MRNRKTTSQKNGRKALLSRYPAKMLSLYQKDPEKAVEDGQPLLRFEWDGSGVTLGKVGPPNHEKPIWYLYFVVENVGKKTSNPATIEIEVAGGPTGESPKYTIEGDSTIQVPAIDPGGRRSLTATLNVTGFRGGDSLYYSNRTPFAELPRFYAWITRELNDGRINSFYPELHFISQSGADSPSNSAQALLHFRFNYFDYRLDSDRITLHFDVSNRGGRASSRSASISVDVHTAAASTIRGSTTIPIPAIDPGAQERPSGELVLGGLPASGIGGITLGDELAIKARLSGEQNDGSTAEGALSYRFWLNESKWQQ